MKILIMGFTKIKYMPYMNFYLDNIDRNTNELHLLYWNRDFKKENEPSGIVLHEFKRYQEDDVSKLSKIASFKKYRAFAKKLISEEKFDFIIVLHSITGVLVADILEKQYNNRFILDYRDSTYEGFAPFKKIVGDLTKASRYTFVSSDAFRKFLPEGEKGKIFTSHNLLSESLNHRDEKRLHGVPSDKIRIAFWGFIRHEEINREIIRKVAADGRFELHYYGREQQIALHLKAYAKELCADNIFFHGEYKPEDRYEFVRNTDLIHNIYNDNNMALAMGNKYYDGIIFYIPQLCFEGSYMAEKAENAGVGLSCNPYDNDFTEKVYKYFKETDKYDFISSCDRELKTILNEYNQNVDIISQCDIKVVHQ